MHKYHVCFLRCNLSTFLFHVLHEMQTRKKATNILDLMHNGTEGNQPMLAFFERRRRIFIPLKISNSLVCWRPCFKSHWLWKCDSKGGFFDGKENKKRFFQLRTIFSVLKASQTLDIFLFLFDVVVC